ncbi:type II toxin-antitoxin system VapC family toxin [Halococcus agarilyticus]|uniref:type II toxin-antitoxin system VapC family toxin n=1 Tax=Halococcus agarilyticus TaxID=1232219 RepID=UPI000677BE02|nr:type II toxin-antitoxin system VapC family toxin [Halococcus agarilyticus]
MILDTSFLIDLMNSQRTAVEKADAIEREGVVQRIPAMTIQELYIGVGYTDTPDDERRKIEAIVDSRPVVDTDAKIARKAGTIDGRLRRDGERIDAGDAAIGATGVVMDEPVLTGNPRHFRHIPGLDVETY